MSKRVKIGNIYVGGGEKIAIQSMSTYKLENISECISEAVLLEKSGCDIMRYSVLDEVDAKSFNMLKKHTKMPLVADIHFDYKLALLSIDGGADKIRINPGNIGSEQKVSEVISNSFRPHELQHIRLPCPSLSPGVCSNS